MYGYGEDGKANVKFNVNYGEFLGENSKYIKSIGVFSALLSQEVYKNQGLELKANSSGAVRDFNKSEDGGDENNKDQSKSAISLLETFGMKDVENCNVISPDIYDTDDITEFVIGHRLVKSNNIEKEVIVIAFRGTNGTIEEWSSNFDVGANTDDYFGAMGYNSLEKDWSDENNHKGFDVTTTRAMEEVETYIENNLNSSVEKVYWVTGHSRGAAIANLLSAKLIDKGDNVFGYTFAAPNTTASTDYNNEKYSSIFNIVNSDDMIPVLPLEYWGFKKYGQVFSVSIKDNYENKWWKAQEGTWENLMGFDYNFNGNLSYTINAFSKVGSSREDLYKFSEDAVLNLSQRYRNRNDALNDALEQFNKYTERIKRYVQVLEPTKRNTGKGGTWYFPQIKQSPACFMMILADMAAQKKYGGKKGGTSGFKVADNYDNAKALFVFSALDSKKNAEIYGKAIDFLNLGGMSDAHYPESYYLIAKNL
jgi:hypothetical protein